MSSFDRTYRNPVTSIPSADPFVLKHAGEYWAYVTGEWQDGRCFGILHSKDLVNWEARAGALAPLQPPAGEQYTCYWAPEVSYDNGIFYLYYSVGDEEHMHIRAATSTEPDGPFIDSGHRLTSEQFAIDAHVFTDADGDRYLFYAADFLDHTHIGTGIVADRMLDAFHLAGSPQPVARARFDWQVYDPNRAEKGGGALAHSRRTFCTQTQRALLPDVQRRQLAERQLRVGICRLGPDGFFERMGAAL
jgi:arabinan endo-1,5-alpha-L-arabinosidase